MERQAFSNQLELLGGETPHTPRASLAEAGENLWESRGQFCTWGDLPRAGAWAVGVPIPSWKQRRAGFAHAASIPVLTEWGLETVSRGSSVSACFCFKAWRQWKAGVWCQCCFLFFPFFPQFTLFLETVEPVVVEAEGPGTFSFVWQPLLSPVEAQWWGSCGLDWLLPWEHTHCSLWTRSRKDGGQGGRRGKSRTGLPRPAALFISPKMVFVQLSWTFVDVQIWEQCS